MTEKNGRKALKKGSSKKTESDQSSDKGSKTNKQSKDDHASKSDKVPRVRSVTVGECHVCGHLSKGIGHYFGASACCDSCRSFYKQFFEENIDELRRKEDCSGDCDLEDKKCRHCRMKRCLAVGMDYYKGKEAKSLNIVKKSIPKAKGKPKEAGVKKSRLSLKGSKLSKSSPGSKSTLESWTKATTEEDKSDDATENVTDENAESAEEEAKVPCVASLHNLGNTCFLNSVIQVLRYTPQFEEQLHQLAKQVQLSYKERCLIAQLDEVETDESKDEEEDYTHSWDIIRHLDGVFHKMNNAEERFMNGSYFIGTRPYELLDTIGHLNPMFEGNQQQDAHEFMRCLLAYVQDASRSVNKYRQRAAETISRGSCKYISEAKSIINSPKEVEMLGGLKETPQKESSPVIAKKVTPTANTRSSKRLSGGPAKDENLTVKLEVKDKLVIKSPPTKRTSRGRKSLTELQNQAFSGQRSILDCYAVRTSNGHIGDADKVPSNGVVKDEVVDVKVDSGANKRLSSKRKAWEPGSEECDETDTQDNDTDTKHKQHDDEKKQLFRKKRRFFSAEQDKGKHQSTGSDTQNGATKVKNTSMSETSQNTNDCTQSCLDSDCVTNDDNTFVEKGQGDNTCVKATVQTKTVHEKKQTARKTMGTQPVGDIAKSEPSVTKTTTKTAFVKIDKNGIANYFRKVAKPQSLGEIDRHTEPVSDCIEEIFQGHVELQTRCSDCEKITVRREEYQDISVAVRRKQLDNDDDDDDDELEECAESLEEKGSDVEHKGEEPDIKGTGFMDKEAELSDTGLHVNKNGLLDIKMEPDAEFDEKGVKPNNKVSLDSVVKSEQDTEEHGLVGVKLEEGCNADDNAQTSHTHLDEDISLSATLAKNIMSSPDQETTHDAHQQKTKSEPTDKSEDDFVWVKESLGEVERLQGDNKYWCDSCCHLAEAERSMHYTSVPNILTLHLKRFAMAHGSLGGFTKLTDHVPLPMVLPCIEDNCTQPEQHRLQLYGVITHTGFTLSCGHYTAYIRAPDHSAALYDPDIIAQANASRSQTNPKSTKPQQSSPHVNTTSPQPSGDADAADPNNNADDNNNCDAVVMETVDEDVQYWFECDDELITVLREDDFLAKLSPESDSTTTPYLLFYQRV